MTLEDMERKSSLSLIRAHISIDRFALQRVRFGSHYVQVSLIFLCATTTNLVRLHKQVNTN